MVIALAHGDQAIDRMKMGRPLQTMCDLGPLRPIRELRVE
jgi:hypothetical protein